MLTQFNGRFVQEPMYVNYAGSDTLRNGYCLALNSDASAAAEREGAEKPSFANILSDDSQLFIVTQEPRNGYVGNGVGLLIAVLPVGPYLLENVQVHTDENVAVGDYLGPIPNSYKLGRGVMRPIFRATEAQNRSATSGLVYGRLKSFSWSELASRKMYRHFDHFTAPNVPGVVAGALASHAYHLSGTTAMAIAPLATAQETVINIAEGGGELALLGTTTTIAQLQQIGAQHLLSTGRSLFCRMRVKIDNIADEDWFWGLGTPPTQSAGVLTTVAQVTSAGTAPAATDYAGFFFDATGGANGDKIIFTQRKASGTAVLESTLIAPVNNTYLDLAFLLRNRVAGGAADAKHSLAFINGALVNLLGDTAAQAAQFPDTVPLAWTMSGITGACCCTIDSLEIVGTL